MIYLLIFTHVCLHLTVYIYLRGELEKGWALGITYAGAAAGSRAGSRAHTGHP